MRQKLLLSSQRGVVLASICSVNCGAGSLLKRLLDCLLAGVLLRSFLTLRHGSGGGRSGVLFFPPDQNRVRILVTFHDGFQVPCGIYF